MMEIRDVNKLLNFKNTVRPKSLIITFMSDVGAVHGKQIWSGNLVQICKWYNITEHSSRISLQRLENEGWIKKIKKRFYIYYEFSTLAENVHNLNHAAVYQKTIDDWDKNWQLIILRKNSDSTDKFIKDITWMGYQKLCKNVYLFPSGNRKQVEDLVNAYNLKEYTVFLSGGMSDLGNSKVMGKMVDEMWETNYIAKVFNGFLEKISRINANVLNKICKTPEVSLYTRIRLIHEYRRIIVRYNKVSSELNNLGGLYDEIYNNMGKLYHKLAESSTEYVVSTMRNSKGPLPKVDKSFSLRFGQSVKGLKMPSNQFDRLYVREAKPFLK